ncbi:class I SAM-dependent DNA methyltransferase [Thalassiella azotivora]
MSGPQDFYDGLAEDYDVLFGDWWAAAEWHGDVVGRLLAERGVAPPASVLDCTCGIGTQALPLAGLGYQVTGADLSPRAVARARVEADRRGLRVRLAVADVREVGEVLAERFDAIVSCDNALPHLLTDLDLRRALSGIRRCLRAGGLLLVSLRDYDALSRERPDGTPLRLHGEPGRRRGAAQAWVWSGDGDRVDITLVVLQEDGGAWRATAHATTYRALRRADLTSALADCGFDGVEWLTPAESGYYQPVVTARAV